MKVQCKMLPGAEDLLPTRAHDGDAGLDLRFSGNAEKLITHPKQHFVLGTGLTVAIPTGYVGLVMGRSGLARKGIRPMNIGVIDSGYRGEVKVHMESVSTESFKVSRGDRIAQLVIVPCWMGALEVMDSLDETTRGDGGFGSTGVA